MRHEIYALLGMALCGALLSFVFDIRRGAQKAVHMPDFAVIAADFLFWLICAAAVVWAIWILNNGAVRTYEFIGLFSGAMLYFATISPFVIKITAAVTGYILKIFKFIFKILLTPFRFLYKIINSIHLKLLNKKARKENNERTEGSNG